MTPREFYLKRVGKRTDVDKRYGSQCWDLYASFWDDVGLNTTKANRNTDPSGYARSIWEQRIAKNLALYFDFIVGAKNFRTGDWVVFPCCSYAPLSHVCMYYEGMAFGQRQHGHWEATLQSAPWEQAYGALRWKGWEAGNMELAEGLNTVTYENVRYKVVMAPAGFGMHVISAKQDGISDDRAVQDIKHIDSDALLVKAKVNGGYFDMSDNTAVKGQHYGVEQSVTNDFVPHQSCYQVFFEDTKGNVSHCTAENYWLNKKDVNFAITPYSVRIANGVLINDMTSAYGDKDSTLNSQTAVFKLANERWCVACTDSGQKCFPRDITHMAQQYGAKELAIMDSGGSTQMVVDGQSIVYSGRWIANVMALAKTNAITPTPTPVPVTDDKDKQISDLTAQVTLLQGKIQKAQEALK